jgi:acetyltransferase-like isoleucine patch superfamily enzyme
MKDVFIHPTAIVESNEIGKETKIWAYTHVMVGAHIGENCNIGDHCFIESGAFVGNNVTIKNGNMIWEGVTLENGVFVGPHIFFTNDLYPRSPRLPQARNRYYSKQKWLVPTLVKKGASLGAGAVIIAGITIGEYAMVGAGSIVTKDVPSYALIKGNPGRISGWVCQCGQPLTFDGLYAICAFCCLSFKKDGEGIQIYTKQEE